MRDGLKIHLVNQSDVPQTVRDRVENKPPPVAASFVKGMYFCKCTGEKCYTEFTLDGELRLYGDIYVPKRVTRVPAVDTSVKDPLTAWIHEYAYHIDPAILKAREEAAKYERAYRSKDECDAACGKAKAAVANAFHRELRHSKAREEARR